MKRSILFYLVVTMVFVGFGAIAQQAGSYNVIKTGNAYIIKTKNDKSAQFDVERMGLNCSTANLSRELDFSKIKSYFDEEIALLFRNIKIQARVYINFQGEITDLYFTTEENPNNYTIDYPRIDKIIRRKMRVEANDDCLPREENRFVSWYIPLFEL